ncbi:MAG: FAD binding domain-containing protein, partial [Candidatus Neomarinimicrobiota bacterium]
MRSPAYLIPATLAEALEHGSQQPDDCVYLAGGTDFMLHRKHLLDVRPIVIDLSEVAELRQLQADAKSVTIGAGVTLAELADHPVIEQNFPLICTAAQSIATAVIRQTATVGGNLLARNRCNYYNQSPDWRVAAGACLRDGGDVCLVTGTAKHCYSRAISDLAPALIALEARITIQRSGGAETVPLIEIYAPDGLKPYRKLGAGAIITNIELDRRPRRTWFRKLRTRASLDFTSLTVAAAVDDSDHARVCLGGVAPAPVLVEGAL